MHKLTKEVLRPLPYPKEILGPRNEDKITICGTIDDNSFISLKYSKEILGHRCIYSDGKLIDIDFKEKIAYHCETQEEADYLVSIAKAKGLSWRSGHEYSTPCPLWIHHKEQMCYNFIVGSGGTQKEYEKEGCKIIKAKEILTLNTNKDENSKTTNESIGRGKAKGRFEISFGGRGNGLDTGDRKREQRSANFGKESRREIQSFCTRRVIR